MMNIQEVQQQMGGSAVNVQPENMAQSMGAPVQPQVQQPQTQGIMPQADQGMGMGMATGLFAGITEEDLKKPMSIIFKTGEVIKGTVIHAHHNAQYKKYTMHVNIETGDNEGDIAIIKVPVDPSKKSFATALEFLKLFWTQDELLHDFKVEKTVGHTIIFTANQPNEFEGNLYQSYKNFKIAQ